MYKSLFFSLLPLLTSSLAIEEITPVSHCDPRTGVPGAVYTCPAPQFRSIAGAECSWTKPETCITWGYKLQKKPRSVGPDPGGVCAFYEQEGCAGETVKLIHCPGVEDTSVGKAEDWGKSMRCVKAGK